MVCLVYLRLCVILFPWKGCWSHSVEESSGFFDGESELLWKLGGASDPIDATRAKSANHSSEASRVLNFNVLRMYLVFKFFKYSNYYFVTRKWFLYELTRYS